MSYINRSGSSFLCQKLSEYDDVFVFPEGDFLIDKLLLNQTKNISEVKRQVRNSIFFDSKMQYWNFSIQDLEEILKEKTVAKIFIQFLLLYKNRVKPSAEILVFKRSNIYAKFDQIKLILSEYSVSLINLYRDPRAIFASQKTTMLVPVNKPFNRNPLITAINWNHYIQYIISHPQYISIKYEDLIDRYEEVFSKLLKKMSIRERKKQSSVTYHDVLPKEQYCIHPYIQKSPIKDRIMRWESILTLHERHIIESVCAEYMKKIKYSNVSQKINWRERIIFIYFKLKIFFKLDSY